STMLLTGGVNATAGWAAGEIGAWYADANTDIAGKYLAHKVAHALLGCAGEAAKGGDCASGAIGGAVGEAFAEMMGHATEGPLTDAQRKQILDLSKLVAVATAAVTGHDVNAAADAAAIAVANNYLLHKEILDYTKAERACRGGNEDQCTVVKIYEAKSAERDQALAAACADSSSSACAIEQQNVRNAQAEILRAGVTDFDYARVAAETKLQADSTLSSSDRLLGAAKGWTAATVDGVISLGKGLVTLAEAAFGDSQA
ncbi:hypothetical protein GO613_21960, partial [Azoarcus communis]|uniref:VENN motif pre-toxin domain-containing protein n=1 Tax=Parazoarcus communis TaxID=41977 RepID=UPI0016AFD2AA